MKEFCSQLPTVPVCMGFPKRRNLRVPGRLVFKYLNHFFLFCGALTQSIREGALVQLGGSSAQSLGHHPQISEVPSGKEEQTCCCFRTELPAAYRVELTRCGVEAPCALGNNGAAFLESGYCCHVKVLFLGIYFQALFIQVSRCLLCVCYLSDGSVVRKPPANSGYLGSVPGSGRSPGGGNGNPLQYCLGNPMDRGAWWDIVHRVAKSPPQLSN